MPFVAVPSVKLGVTVRPPDTALSSVTVNAIPSPSSAEASSMVNAGALSSLRIVPVAVSVVVIEAFVAVRLTVNVSSGSNAASSVVATVKLFVSPAVPAKSSDSV